MSAPKVSLEKMSSYNARIPFNAWLGLEVLSADHRSVSLKVPWRVEFAGSPGMTHSGILASLIDSAAFLTLLAARGTGGPTVDMRVDYHRSTANGALYVHGKLLRAGATICTAEVEIVDADGRLIASGRCVFLTRSRGRADEFQVEQLPMSVAVSDPQEPA